MIEQSNLVVQQTVRTLHQLRRQVIGIGSGLPRINGQATNTGAHSVAYRRGKPPRSPGAAAPPYRLCGRAWSRPNRTVSPTRDAERFSTGAGKLRLGGVRARPVFRNPRSSSTLPPSKLQKTAPASGIPCTSKPKSFRPNVRSRHQRLQCALPDPDFQTEILFL